MKRAVIALLAVTIALALTIGGCAKKDDGLALVSGQWKSAKDGSPVIIELEKAPKTIAFHEKKFAVSVTKIEGDRISLMVEQESGQKATWELVKVWDDNGSSFDLDLVRGTSKERLSHS